MNRELFLMWWGLGLMALLAAACGPLGRSGGSYESNGERIYFSGTSANGRISYSGGDSGGGMMGRDQLACADCHGADGSGGPHVMHMTAMDAPDIRWSTLAEAEHGGHDDGEAEMEHPPYDEETFKRAVTRGLDPGGAPLDSAMPRWRMPDTDLDDLIAFLKTLN
jgi:mono/diheme cytochrome c family protein